MYTLYWSAMSGTIAVQTLLEEAGIAYDEVRLDTDAGEDRYPWFRALNPSGRLPAVKLPDGDVIGDAAAITLALGERHHDSELLPQPGDSDRAAFLHWLLYLASSGEAVLVRLAHPEQFTADARAIGPVRDVAYRHAEELFEVIERVMDGNPYFLERGYTMLDIFLEMLTLWHPERDAMLARHRQLATLCGAVEARPAFARVLAEHRAPGPKVTPPEVGGPLSLK